MSGSITLTIGDTNTHTATLTCVNLDGTPATNVAITYASDTPTVCDIDASTGVLTLVSLGTATLSGTGVRGAFTHSYSVTVTVAADDVTGDFTASLIAN